MIGLPLYVSVQTARFAAKVIEEYAVATVAALESEADLDRVIQTRSGQGSRQSPPSPRPR